MKKVQFLFTMLVLEVCIFIIFLFFLWITKSAMQKYFEFPPGTDKKLPTDSTSETFDSLYRVLSVVEEKFNEKKKRRNEKKKMEKEKQVQVEEKMEMDIEKEKQTQVEEEKMEMDMEKETQVQVGEEGSEEEESGEEEGAEEGENSKVSVGRNCLTPLNISFMLQNIDKDEILKLLVKENEDTDGTEL